MNGSAPVLLGLVLAGGRSRRFGRDKAGVRVDGQDLLARTVALLQDACDDVYVSARADQLDDALRSRYRIITDTEQSLGPAAGLLAAHARFPEAAWFVVACDLPLLDAGTVNRLAQERRADKEATGFRNPAGGFPEPLCAIWEPATLERFRKRVAAQEISSPREMLADSEMAFIALPEARALDNMNTGADFERLGLGAGRNPAGRD
jgi:molybdopterin-guanine dinucleotide biosynthesis protein A